MRPLSHPASRQDRVLGSTWECAPCEASSPGIADIQCRKLDRPTPRTRAAAEMPCPSKSSRLPSSATLTRSAQDGNTLFTE
jgi:hypothetical protein